MVAFSSKFNFLLIRLLEKSLLQNNRLFLYNADAQLCKLNNRFFHIVTHTKLDVLKHSTVEIVENIIHSYFTVFQCFGKKCNTVIINIMFVFNLGRRNQM